MLGNYMFHSFKMQCMWRDILLKSLSNHELCSIWFIMVVLSIVGLSKQEKGVWFFKLELTKEHNETAKGIIMMNYCNLMHHCNISLKHHNYGHAFEQLNYASQWLFEKACIILDVCDNIFLKLQCCCMLDTFL